MESIQIILTAVLLLGSIVFIHELGHFVAAKLIGVKVITFSVGFGRRLFSTRIGDTTFCLSVIPLGGYVLPASGPKKDVPENYKTSKLLLSIGNFSEFEKQQLQASSTATSGTLAQASLAQKLFFYTNGLIFNVALVLLAVFSYSFSETVIQRKTSDVLVGTVFSNLNGDKAGLRQGDKIIRANDTAIASWEDLGRVWGKSGILVPIKLGVLRNAPSVNAAELAVTILPEMRVDKMSGKAVPSLGFNGETIESRLSLTESLEVAVYFTGALFTMIPTHFLGLNAADKEAVSQDDSGFNGFFGGLVEMGVAASGSYWEFIKYFSILSIVIVYLNALPIPGFDGGQVLVAIIEAINGTELSFVVKERLSHAGLLISFLLMGLSVGMDAIEVLLRAVG